MDSVTLSTWEEFRAFDFNNTAVKEIILASTLMFPFRHQVEHARKLYFETINEAPYHYPSGYRRAYHHPHIYQAEIFNDECVAKIDEFRFNYLKSGRLAIFNLTDDNLPLLCAIMGSCYGTCKADNVDNDNKFNDITNVPYPLKHSDEDSYTWIWSCDWHRDWGDTLETPEDVKKLTDYDHSFANYHATHFCVKPLPEYITYEGVTGFELRIGNGKLIVLPCGKPNSILNVLIEDFPGEINKKHYVPPVTFSVAFESKIETSHCSTINMLRILLIYYASIKYDGLIYDKSKAPDKRMSLMDGDKIVPLEWDYLFLTRCDDSDENLRTTLDELLKPLIMQLVPKNHILLLNGKSRPKLPSDKTLDIECYQQFKIVFSSQALQNFQNLTIESGENFQHFEKLIEDLPRFKEEMLSIL